MVGEGSGGADECRRFLAAATATPLLHGVVVVAAGSKVAFTWVGDKAAAGERVRTEKSAVAAILGDVAAHVSADPAVEFTDATLAAVVHGDAAGLPQQGRTPTR